MQMEEYATEDTNMESQFEQSVAINGSEIMSCDDDENVYGQLILLGYNGCPESKLGGPSKRHRTKMTLKRREKGNGIKKGDAHVLNSSARDVPSVQDSTRHTISYSYGKSQTVVVEYSHDPAKDMFQIGRSSESQIDFTVVDTWLSSASSNAGSPHSKKEKDRSVSSTISRYACRLLVDRENGNKAYLYAAGFDSIKNIFLGEKATKWTRKNGDIDGLTTNGVLILHPDRNTEDLNNEETETGAQPMYNWREVSVDGDIYTLRDTRSSSAKGQMVTEETNMLQDGTLIDLCGATILWRTADGLDRSPTLMELEMALDRLNAGKPQCPVNLNTLIIPKKKSSRGVSSRQAYVYLRCGHVQGKHEWGKQIQENGQFGAKCPICLIQSERVIQLTMGMEPSFHLESGPLDHAFNPCGHVASKSTVRYWSRIPLPQGTNSFHSVCPFCTTLLATEKPFVRLIFQDHCYS